MSHHFTTDTFTFLKELAANNRREWFARHRSGYEAHVQDPALRFILDFAPLLAEISPSFRADPRKSGGSLFRIYRDTRFSKDKSPYKTHVGIQFRHTHGKDVHTPGFYLHVEPGQCFVGCGIWHPAPPVLRTIRDAIVDDPAGWTSAIQDRGFQDRYELEGDSLSRAPRGYDPDHPLIADLRRKDFIGSAPLSDEEVTAPGFLESFARICGDGMPLQRFLCRALDVPLERPIA